MYTPCMYMVYTMNIHWLCRLPAYPSDIPSLYQMGLFSTFFIMICQWYTKYIQWIFNEYTWYIIGISL
jgi:hypothetical protein